MTTDGVNIAASHAQEPTALKQWRERESKRDRDGDVAEKETQKIFVGGK